MWQWENLIVYNTTIMSLNAIYRWSDHIYYYTDAVRYISPENLALYVPREDVWRTSRLSHVNCHFFQLLFENVESRTLSKEERDISNPKRQWRTKWTNKYFAPCVVSRCRPYCVAQTVPKKRTTPECSGTIIRGPFCCIAPVRHNGSSVRNVRALAHACRGRTK